MNPAEETPEFAALLLSHAKGRAHDEATTALRDAVEAVQTTGKPAKVTVELTISPVPKFDNAIRIEDKVTAKIPTEPRTSMWFTDDDCALHRNDPRQRPLWDDQPADGKTAAAGHDN